MYISIYRSEEFFKNPEKDNAGSLNDSCSKTCNQNHSEIPVEKLIVY